MTAPLPPDPADVTDADRAKAIKLLFSSEHHEATVDAIAAALAAERAAVARPVLALHVPSHAYCVVCDRDRDVEAFGNAFPCDHYTSFCRCCDFAWPCLTVSDLRRALAGPDDARQDGAR